VAGRLSTYQSGRDVSVERGLDLSTVLLSRAIEAAVGRGCRELDMLRGAQSYKTSWAGRTRPVLTLHASSGAAGSAVERGVRSLRTTKRALTRAAGAVVSRSGPAAQE
jgi:CelD/BcsL family acetyltransferase involved in cellulose biosynthesis